MIHRTELRPALLGQVRVEGGFWGQRREINRRRTLVSQHEQLVQTGRLDGVEPTFKPGDRNAHHIFWDSDIAKWMEAVAYSLTTHPDVDLAARLEDAVSRFACLQRPDGYVNSWFTAVEPERRWTNLRDCHELYCAGHLIEAAVAHFGATGKQHFLEVMGRYADYIGSVFGRGPGQRRGYPGHEEIELALVKLHQATGQARYLDLARYFVDERGRQPYYYDQEAEARGDSRRGGYEYCQAHRPVREQDRAVGHAVRAMYLYAGMADIARADRDEELVRAGLRLWENVCRRQLYVTGSVGASSQGERFTEDYDLPEETSYCETCAAIGLVFWNQRLLNLHGEGRFADVIERALYNGVLSGISLSGDRYFYVNPLASAGHHHRSEWFGCACCPPNLSRLIAGIGPYLYSEGEEAWVHLYAAGSAVLATAAGEVTLAVRTQYPWSGEVEIEVDPGREAAFALNLRLPGWCRGPALSVNGQSIDLAATVHQGYARLERSWRPGDRVILSLPMPVERVWANPAVRVANGKVALQKGPVVYCLEQVDNGLVPLSRIALPRAATLRAVHRPDLLGGVDVIHADAAAIDAGGWGSALYRSEPVRQAGCRLTAVPYCAWDNRQAGQMLVWLRET